MDDKNAIAYIREALTDVKKSGQDFVSVEALDEYLTQLDSATPDTEEARKLQHDSNLAYYRAQHETNLEMFKSVLEAGRTALTSCILVNGGAAVALLAYLGNFVSNNPDAQPSHSIVRGLVIFTTAVLLGAAATGVRYLSQASYSKDWNRAGAVFTVISIVFVLSAYVLFGFGIHAAYKAFS